MESQLKHNLPSTIQLILRILNNATVNTFIPAPEILSETKSLNYYFFAKTHNLIPLLLYEIKANKLILPRHIEFAFNNDYLGFILKDYQRKKQLHEIIQILNFSSIPHILLKGSHLAENVYEKSYLRWMSDIDILIRNEDFEKCQTELSKIGYEYSQNEIEAFSLLPFKDKHFPALTKADSLPVEFHWNIHRNYNYKFIDRLWERASNFTIDGRQAKGLSPEDLLIHICVHKALDDNFMSSLVLLSDIREILLKYNIDWNKVNEIVTSEWINSSKALFTAFHLYNLLMDGNIPQDFLKKIRPHDFDKEMEELIANQMFSTNTTNLSTSNTYSSIEKLKGQKNPLNFFKYLMTPKRICLRYNKDFSICILPYLYLRRIAEKVSEVFRLIFLSFNHKDTTYISLKNAGKVKKWLRN